jgi:hypothetical protein
MIDNYAALASTRAHGYRPLFIHVGGLHDIGGELADSLQRHPAGWVLHHLGDVDDESTVDPTRNIVIRDLESALTYPGTRSRIPRLRAQLQRDPSGVGLLILLSRLPKARLIFEASSSLVAESTQWSVPLPETGTCRAVASALGVNDDQFDRMSSYSGRSVALTRALGRASVEGLTGRLFVDAARPVLRRTIEELGAELSATLDYWVNEIGSPSIPRSELTALDCDALRSAGLTTVELDDTGDIALLPYSLRLWQPFREELRAFLDGICEPTESWVQAVHGLFFVERMLRAVAKDQLIAAFGAGWKQRAISDAMVEELLRKANQDRDIAVKRLGELLNPLEYLTIAELLALCRSLRPVADALSDRLLSKMELDFVQVRNRVMHMRLLRSGDGELIRSYVRQLRLRSRSSIA